MFIPFIQLGISLIKSLQKVGPMGNEDNDLNYDYISLVHIPLVFLIHYNSVQLRII
jgi:hypothetical protein